MNVYDTLKKLNLTLPKAPEKGGVYSPCVRFDGNLLYVSGCGCVIGEPVLGKLGADLTIEQGQEQARNCALNILAVLERETGDLNRITKCVKLLAFVAGTDTFYQQPQVANGASTLLVELFGEAPARSAIGVNALPGNIPVEIEGIFEMAD
ncbi:MAG: RidA family protein [Clostridia bacterium]|nr:RidA family protein [Clostridia bacterium]